MCRRFVLDAEARDELLDRFGQHFSSSFSSEVRVTFKSLILLKKEDGYVLDEKKFGYLNYDTIVYNARCESIEKKVLFKNEFKRSRCIVLATGFYEPDRHGNERLFLPVGTDLLYMAGIVKEDNFILLTCDSSEDVKYVHPRMPLCLRREDVPLYLDTKNGSFLFDIMKLPKISSPEESEQMSLF